MSLLQNQDFIIYRIRSRYLQRMKDGVGERVITVNPSSLNVPAFKNAGWGFGAEIKRTYSPPIPCGPAGEYFASAAGKAFNDEATVTGVGMGGDEGSTLMGSRFSSDSFDTNNTKTPRGDGVVKGSGGLPMHREEDDSSDMSDDSDDDDAESADKPGQKITFDFSKKEIPHRPRAGSSPIRNAPQVLITSPPLSRKGTRRLRGGSHGDVDFNKGSAAVDYETVPGADEDLLSSGVVAEQERLHSDIVDRLRSSPNSSLPKDRGFDSADESDASSTLSSDFMPTADSNPTVIGNSLSPPRRAVQRASPAALHALPPPIRPVSMAQPVSLLTMLLKAKAAEEENPMAEYGFFSGKGELKPLYLKIYIPFSRSSPFEVVVSLFAKEESGESMNRETTVAEVIGYVLYKYIEEKREPSLNPAQLDINRWAFRMMDDGEPDNDFPPLERTHPVTTFMAKKLPRGRFGAAAKEPKLEGEFALCRATDEQYEEYRRVTPSKTSTKPPTAIAPPTVPSILPASAAPADISTAAPTVGPSARQVAADASASSNNPAPRTGPSKILRIHLSTIDEFAQSISVCVTTDTYISEVLEQVCKKKHLDKTKYILRVTGVSNVVAPLDRTVVSLGDRAELDLVRRRFIPASEGLGDRPGSPSTVDSPNAPLNLSGSSSRTPKKGKFLQPALWAPDMLSSRDYLKFTVWRKSNMSFMSRHERILAIDGEYLHIMPSDQKTLLNAFESQAKTRSIHISTIIGCKTYRKAPSCFKVVVMRPQKETKRYEFEATGEDIAGECVGAIRKVMMEYKMDHHGGAV